jgi:hypothetical protein
MLQLDTNISLVLDSCKDICYLLAMHSQSWSEEIIRYVLAIIGAKKYVLSCVQVLSYGQTRSNYLVYSGQMKIFAMFWPV